MRRRELPGPALALIAILIATSSALVFCWGLAAIARPAGLKERVAALEVQAERTQTLMRRRGGTVDYPAGAVCPGLSEAQLEPIRQRLRAAATGANLGLGKISVARPSTPSLEAITPIDVQFETNGAYEATLLMLDSLSRQTPLLYVDTVDLRSRTDSVNLQLSGRIYCWTAAPR